MKDLANKVAIVTGGGSGIGREVARLYAREGAKVVVADIDEAGGADTVSMINSEKGEAFFIRADSPSAPENKMPVDKTLEKYGSLHITCNNAGIAGRYRRRVSGTVK